MISDALEAAISKIDAKHLYAHGKFRESGNRLRGPCPWHKSKSGTAFVVTKTNKLWWCAGCQIGGGPIQYLHRMKGGDGSPKGQEFVEIAKEICGIAGVEFPERESIPEDSERYLFLQQRSALLAWISEISRTLLKPEHRAYLLQRGFTEEHVKDLGIGFYDITTLREHLKGYDAHFLADTGVLWKKLHGYLSFPWWDAQGRLLTLYFKWPAKTPPGDLPKTTALQNPKLNGEPCLASKFVPYLFNRTKGQKRLVLVEGVTDAALAQVMGDNRVVACVAASLSGGQVQTFKKAGIESVTICLDPDKAGDRGIESCAKGLSAAGIRALVAPRLPDGMDPDEFILARGVDAWRSLIDKAVPWGTKVVAIPETFTAAQLEVMECREPTWLVPGILPEGVTLLCGRPKMGKSFMVLEILLALASGGYALGRKELQVPPMGVLYISLEDIPRRLKERIASLSRNGWTANFHMATQWPKLDEGGIEALEAWLDIHPDVKVVAIDTWGRIKGRVNGQANAYENDVRLFEPVKTMADKRGVSLNLVTHSRKAPGDDPLDEVSGSTGLTGSADAIMLLRRSRDGKPTLYVRGRDVEENEYSLQRESNGGWTLLGRAEERLTEDQQAAVDVLRQAGTMLTLKEIRAATGQTTSASSHMMRKLLQRGVVDSPTPGVYLLKAKIDDDDFGVQPIQPLQRVQPVQPKNGSSEPSTDMLNGLNTLNTIRDVRVKCVECSRWSESRCGAGKTPDGISLPRICKDYEPAPGLSRRGDENSPRLEVFG